MGASEGLEMERAMGGGRRGNGGAVPPMGPGGFGFYPQPKRKPSRPSRSRSHGPLWIWCGEPGAPSGWFWPELQGLWREQGTREREGGAPSEVLWGARVCPALSTGSARLVQNTEVGGGGAKWEPGCVC